MTTQPRPALIDACAEPAGDDGLDAMIVGRSRAAAGLRQAIRNLARHDAPLLLTGPTGSGKDLAAQALHRLGSRRQHPFIAVNCAAIPADLIESELFGHERGAFTGASERRTGLFELAGRGILFLDEIGDMPSGAQVRLLRVLEERRFRRIGGTALIPFAGQIICATHRDLPAAIEAGQFRRDLWYRIAVLMLRLPALKERSEDIPQLVASIIAQLRLDLEFSTAALAMLARHSWPGNVRELRNLVIRAGAIYPGGTVPACAIAGLIHPADGRDAMAELPSDERSLEAILRAVELHQLRQALAAHGGVVARAARALGINRTTLVEKMRRFGLDRIDDTGSPVPSG